MPGKRVAKKETVEGNTIAFTRVENVPITQLKGHEKNPRQGNIEVVMESLQTFGQYRPILANQRNKTIIAGHHTWLAARRLGWTEISVAWVDVDDDTHKRIMLMDNRSADLGTYDDTILAELFRDLGDFTATGYDEDEVASILANVGSDLDRAVTEFESEQEERQRFEDMQKRSQTFEGSPLGDEPDPDDEDDAGEGGAYKGRSKPEEGALEGASADLNGGLVQFKPPAGLVFEGIGYFGIPKVKPEMLMTFDELPEKLDSWAGSATKDWPVEDTWWLYNWGVDSTSGMRDISKVIISFYCYDDYFDNWWWYPERYIGKVVNSGIKYIVSPDYTIDSEEPRAFGLWQFYRSRWLMRYFQECGLKVIPNIGWRDGDLDFLKKYVIGTLPKNLPMIAIQLQTIDPETVKGGMDTYYESIQMVFDELKPEGALVYASTQGREVLAKHVNTGKTELRVIGTRMEKLSEKAKGRQRKTTI